MAVKKDEKTGTWYFYGSYKMKNGKYRQYKKRGFQKKKDAVKAEIIFKENIKDPYKNITLEELFKKSGGNSRLLVAEMKARL